MEWPETRESAREETRRAARREKEKKKQRQRMGAVANVCGMGTRECVVLTMCAQDVCDKRGRSEKEERRKEE